MQKVMSVVMIWDSRFLRTIYSQWMIMFIPDKITGAPEPYCHILTETNL